MYDNILFGFLLWFRETECMIVISGITIVKAGACKPVAYLSRLSRITGSSENGLYNVFYHSV